VHNKSIYFKAFYLGLAMFITGTQPAWACFPGYQQYLESRELLVNGASFYLEKQNGRSYEQVVSYNQANYRFDLQLLPVPVEQYQLIKLGFADGNYSKDTLAIYPLKDNKVQGYVLLELASLLDICDQEADIQKELQDKQRVYNYLPQLPVPAGLELQFYEQVKGKFVERLALLVNPNKDFAQPPHLRGRYITLRARYRIELEPFIKPEIQRYFEHNLSDWAWHAEP